MWIVIQWFIGISPNPFDLYTDEWCWSKRYFKFKVGLTESIKYYQKFYPNQTLDLYDYYNSGVSFLRKNINQYLTI